MKKEKFDIPVLFIVFKRMNTTKRVFERIQKIQPKKLYIAGDGARLDRPEELSQVNELREFLMKNINWPCEVQTRFMDKNLGCKYNPQSAITWFFENEEKGIILEDDCLPSLSFFRYCQELLNRYENDLRVWGISGTNLQPNIQVPYSYYFSNYFMTWGWATWRNRWQQHLKELPKLNLYFNDPVMQNKLPSKIANQRLLNYVKNSFEDKLDAWDYLWIFSCMANNGLLATPSKNMIQNIGFGEDATHTFGNSRNQVTEVEIDFPLEHPLVISTNNTIDQSFYKNVFRWKTVLEKIKDPNHIKAFIHARLRPIFNR